MNEDGKEVFNKNYSIVLVFDEVEPTDLELLFNYQNYNIRDIYITR